jgi:hypothetical protein
MDGDARSFRIALTADAYVNPPPGGVDGLAALDEAGWGVMQLPAADYPAEMAGRILADIADQVLEFHRHGYDIVLVGEHAGLAGALADVAVPLPEQVVPDNAEELRRFLGARPAPQVIRRTARPASSPHGPTG